MVGGGIDAPGQSFEEAFVQLELLAPQLVLRCAPILVRPGGHSVLAGQDLLVVPGRLAGVMWREISSKRLPHTG
ncbi:hypothetical protein BKE38_26280 [Pseudoroseomonas deserti]|uniref:Uncharacterized protein n=1 Tax=Teichococcus deserti TaxID=1817963 RepID=A0A1V2GUT7_9PROT|nr:hypothetical protein BKE38_26280 [Pseudoroseomonas deserti]